MDQPLDSHVLSIPWEDSLSLDLKFPFSEVQELALSSKHNFVIMLFLQESNRYLWFNREVGSFIICQEISIESKES